MSNMQIFFVAANPKQSFFRWMLQLSLKKLLQYTWVLSLEYCPFSSPSPEGTINREYFEGTVKVTWIWLYFGFFSTVEKCCNIDAWLSNWPHNFAIKLKNWHLTITSFLTPIMCQTISWLAKAVTYWHSCISFAHCKTKDWNPLLLEMKKKNKATCTRDTTEDRKKTFVNSANAQHLHCFYL